MNNFESTLDQIEKSLRDLPSNADVAELRDRINGLEQKGGMRQEGHTGTTTNLGATVATKFREVSEQFAATKNVRFTVPLETKSIGAFTGASSIIASHGTLGSGMIAATPAAMMLVGNLPSKPTGGILTGHYAKYTDTTGAPAVQASEGAAKAEASPVFVDVAQNAITVAGWATVSEQALRGDGALETLVNTFLAGKVLQAADTTLIAGTAATAWPFAGYDALATAYPSATYTGLGDAIAEAVQNMRQDGFLPDIVAINSMAYLDIILSKNTGGDYLLAGALTHAPSDIRLHGCKVVFSSSLTTGEALVFDSRYCELGVSNDLTVEIGTTSDNFTRNLKTVRAEIGLIPTMRHIGAVRLVTPAPA